MKMTIKKGTTSKLIQVFIQDTSVTTGAGLTGLVFNTASLTAYYYREGAASATAISLATMTLGTWATSGFVVVDGTNMPGVYQIGIPDAAIASGANSVTILLKGATNMAPCVLEIDLVAYDPTDGVRLGLTAMPNAAAGANGGLPLSVDSSGRVDVLKLNGTSQTARDIGASVLLSSGSGTGQLDFTSGVVKANATQWVGGTIPAVNVTGVPKVDLIDIDGLATNGNNATLNLKKLNVVNNAGDAIVGTSSGSSGCGMSLTGNASGDGLRTQGGSGGGAGSGIAANGTASTPGLIASGGTVDISCGSSGRISGELTGPVNGIGSTGRTDVGTALTSQGLTTTRAGYLDTLNGLVAAIWATALSDLTALPAATASVLSGINWLYMLGRNRRKQTSTTETVYKANATTPVATSTKSDDGTTFERGAYS